MRTTSGTQAGERTKYPPVKTTHGVVERHPPTRTVEETPAFPQPIAARSRHSGGTVISTGLIAPGAGPRGVPCRRTRRPAFMKYFSPAGRPVYEPSGPRARPRGIATRLNTTISRELGETGSRNSAADSQPIVAAA